MKDALALLSRFLLTDLSPLTKPKGPLSIRLIASLAAFFSVGLGYVLGCRALYAYLEPFWGEVVSLLAICALLLITSLLLFAIAWFLKPTTSPLTNLVSEMQKNLSEMSNHEIIKKAISLISVKTVMTIFAVAAMASYFSNSSKKNS